MKRGRPALRLKRGHEAARTHPWIFKGDVADASEVEPGSEVTVIDAGGRFVGRGFYNPRPALCCRILTWADEPLDAGFFPRRIAAAVGLRRGPSQAPPASPATRFAAARAGPSASSPHPRRSRAPA